MLQSSVKTTFHLHNKKSFWSFLWVTRRTGFWDKGIRQKSKYVPVYSILFHKIQKSCNHDRIWICIQHIQHAVSRTRYSSNNLRSCPDDLCPVSRHCPVSLQVILSNGYTVVSSTKKIFWDFSLRADIYKTCSWFKGSPHEKKTVKRLDQQISYLFAYSQVQFSGPSIRMDHVQFWPGGEEIWRKRKALWLKGWCGRDRIWTCIPRTGLEPAISSSEG